MSVSNICNTCNNHIKLTDIREGDYCKKLTHDSPKCSKKCRTCSKECCDKCIKSVNISDKEVINSCKTCTVECGICGELLNIHIVTYRCSNSGIICYRCCV